MWPWWGIVWYFRENIYNGLRMSIWWPCLSWSWIPRLLLDGQEISAPSEYNLANECGLVLVHNLEHVLEKLYDYHDETRVSWSRVLKSPLELQFNNRGKCLIAKNAMNEWKIVTNLMTSFSRMVTGTQFILQPDVNFHVE